MLNSRRILITIFALGLMFPPSWVLCVEAGGEVRVERMVVECCDGEAGPGGAPIAAAPGANDCGDCRDVAVPTSIHRSKRVQDDCAASFCATAPLVCLLPIQHRETVRFPIAHRPSQETLAALASVVILR